MKYTLTYRVETHRDVTYVVNTDSLEQAERQALTMLEQEHRGEFYNNMTVKKLNTKEEETTRVPFPNLKANG